MKLRLNSTFSEMCTSQLTGGMNLTWEVIPTKFDYITNDNLTYFKSVHTFSEFKMTFAASYMLFNEGWTGDE